jgi:hypothetical protein
MTFVFGIPVFGFHTILLCPSSKFLLFQLLWRSSLWSNNWMIACLIALQPRKVIPKISRALIFGKFCSIMSFLNTSNVSHSFGQEVLLEDQPKWLLLHFKAITCSMTYHFFFKFCLLFFTMTCRNMQWVFLIILPTIIP